MDCTTSVVYLSRWKIIGFPAQILLRLLAVEIPRSVQIGRGFRLAHGGIGTVIHADTVIGDNVLIYHGVTLGRSDTYTSRKNSQFRGIYVSNDVIIGTGAAILCKNGVLTIGSGAIIGANAVVLGSVPNNEIWAGNPARCIGRRSPSKSDV